MPTASGTSLSGRTIKFFEYHSVRNDTLGRRSVQSNFLHSIRNATCRQAEDTFLRNADAGSNITFYRAIHSYGMQRSSRTTFSTERYIPNGMSAITESIVSKQMITSG
jgi:hypothetical protein